MTAAKASDDMDLAAEVKELRAELAALTRRMGSIGGEAANEGVSFLRERGAAMMDRLGESAHNVEDHLADYVREKPLTSLAIAAGVGCLSVMLLRRR